MKTLIRNITLTALAISMVGCYSNHDLDNPERVSGGEVLGTTAGALLGGATAYAVGDGDPVEAAIGSVAGGALGYGVSNNLKNRKANERALELAETNGAKLVSRFEDAWDREVNKPLEHTESQHQGHMARYLEPLEYPEGTYQGINYYSRTVDPTDNDPLNPDRK